MSFRRRQLVTAALTANAVRPLGGARTAFPVYLAGLLAGELAPQLLVATVLDATAELTVRRSRSSASSRTGLAAAAVATAGLGYLILTSVRSATRVETNLREALGEDYLDDLGEAATAEDLRLRLREIAHPFRRTHPDVEVVRDINYTEGGRRARLDIYRPRGVHLDEAPVLLQVHGGGWTVGNKTQQGRLLMNRMAQRGWVCVAMNYRLAPKHPFPAQIVDVKKAIAWTRRNIAAYGGDPAYLVVTGGSAGGHLAALAALTPGEKEYQPGFEDAETSLAACVVFYGVYDLAGISGMDSAKTMRDSFLAPWVFRKDPASDLDEFVRASPLARVSPEAPDFFVLHGANDSMVDVRQARSFVERLRAESKASVTYAEFPSAQHAFEVFGSIRSHHALAAVERWLLHHRALWLRGDTQVSARATAPPPPRRTLRGPLRDPVRGPGRRP